MNRLKIKHVYKYQHSEYQFDQDRGTEWKTAQADVASSLNIVIYFIDQKTPVVLLPKISSRAAKFYNQHKHAERHLAEITNLQTTLILDYKPRIRRNA